MPTDDDNNDNTNIEVDDFMKGFDTGVDVDFGFDIVSEEELGQKEVSIQKSTEALESNVQGISNLESKVDRILSSLSGLKSLLDFDELNIEGKLDKILNEVGEISIPEPVATIAPEGSTSVVTAEESTETKEKLERIIQAIGDPEKRKADAELRIQNAIKGQKELVNNKLKEIEKMILPLLYKLIKPDNLGKNYIYWPNRKDIIERQIKKIVGVTRG